MERIDLLADLIVYHRFAPANGILTLVSYKFPPKPLANTRSTDFCLRDSPLWERGWGEGNTCFVSQSAPFLNSFLKRVLAKAILWAISHILGVLARTLFRNIFLTRSLCYESRVTLIMGC